MSDIRSVFVLNTGSSSVKFRVVNPESGAVSAEGLVERIGERIGEAGSDTPDHRVAIDRVLAGLDRGSIDAVGHRIVHGGDRFVEATQIGRAHV